MLNLVRLGALLMLFALWHVPVRSAEVADTAAKEPGQTQITTDQNPPPVVEGAKDDRERIRRGNKAAGRAPLADADCD